MNPKTAVTVFVLTYFALVIGDADAGGFADRSIRQAVIEQSKFIQIPGPNPIITPGPEGSWDESVVEASDAFRDAGKYYFYYHATGGGKGYRLGVASADRPLGPFKKHGDKPILDLGEEGSWEDVHVACAYVMKGGGKKYYMWYSGCSKDIKWSIGLATADDPLGPWKKYKDNPVLEDFGYLGGVVRHKGKYRIYAAHPIHMPWARWDEGKSRSETYHTDYSPLAVAIGDKPEGPFTICDKNPLMVQGEPGDWDEGGISEAEVLYHNGMFHMYYGATERLGPRTESIGYAYSFDGFEFYKYGNNPVATRWTNPNAAAFAEVHAIIEPPFVYLYHTLRYERDGGDRFPWHEHLGVQVLATQTPFSLAMPVLTLKVLEAGKTTALGDCPPISLGHIARAAITVECTYTKKAQKPVRLHVRSSYDGINYDTVDLYSFDNELRPGETTRKTFGLDTKARFIKVLVENPDKSQQVSDIKITASLSG